MMRPVFTIALLLLGLLSAFVLLTRTQPYSDEDLHAILVPDCATPCFIGIYPGVTSGDDAFAVLSNHPWITNVDFVRASVGASGDKQDGTISWSWTGAQPPLLRTPYLVAGEAAVQNGVVDSIKLRTAIPFGAVWLTLGWPPNGWIRPSRTYLLQYDNQVAVYPAYGLEIRTLVKHPLRAEDFWTAPTDIYFEMNPPDNFSYSRPCWWACEG
jgi:hypothetical protein